MTYLIIRKIIRQRSSAAEIAGNPTFYLQEKDDYQINFRTRPESSSGEFLQIVILLPGN
jgi:hypothetical protein